MYCTIFVPMDCGCIYIYIYESLLSDWSQNIHLAWSPVGLNDLSPAHRFDKAVSALRIAGLNLREVAREFSSGCPGGKHLVILHCSAEWKV